MQKLPLILTFILSITSANLAMAKFVFTKTGFFGKGNDYAIEGYDATSYLENGKPTKGNSDYSLKYQGDTWLFSTAKNRDLFQNNPQKYAPQYGGACAWREAQDGVEVYGDPNIWTLIDNKLYLNYNKEVNERWKKDIPGFIKTADKFWLKEFKTLN